MTKGAALFTTFNGFEVTVGYLTICIVTAIIAILVIIFNALVVHTMVCHRNTKTISDCFLSCLAISDLIMGITLLYITSYSVLQYQIFSECLVRFGQSNSMFACSTFHRLAFTIDRFIKIISPLHYYKIFTKSSVVLISVFIWVISLLIGFLPLLGWRNELPEYGDGHLECRFFGVLTEGFLTLILCLLTGATCVMVVLYVVIFYVARKQANSIAAQLQGFTSKSYLDKHSFKLAKTVSIVVGISNVCWLPTCKYRYHMGQDGAKPVFGVSYNARHKSVSSATETR